MKILVYGAGVLGCNLAKSLYRAGKDVTLLARGNWIPRLREDSDITRHPAGARELGKRDPKQRPADPYLVLAPYLGHPHPRGDGTGPGRPL